MSFIQILLIILILLIVWRLFKKYQAHSLGRWAFLGWLFFWLVVLLVVIWPETSSFLARVLGVGRGADLMIYLALVFIFYFLFYFAVKIYKLEQDLAKIVRHLALKEGEEKDK
jgi:hypothetical protein